MLINFTAFQVGTYDIVFEGEGQKLDNFHFKDGKKKWKS